MVALKNIEKGNTLIVILILIVVVTIIGLEAIRESITSLKNINQQPSTGFTYA